MVPYISCDGPQSLWQPQRRKERGWGGREEGGWGWGRGVREDKAASLSTAAADKLSENMRLMKYQYRQ